jgi:hypothetical protein
LRGPIGGLAQLDVLGVLFVVTAILLALLAMEALAGRRTLRCIGANSLLGAGDVGTRDDWALLDLVVRAAALAAVAARRTELQ